MATWKMILEEFNYKLFHKKGKENISADFFSRSFPINESRKDESILKNLILGSIQIRIKDNETITLILTINNEGIYDLPYESRKNCLCLLHKLMGHPGSYKMFMTV